MNNQLCHIVGKIETGDVFTLHSTAEKFNCTLGTAFDIIMYLKRNKLVAENDKGEYVVNVSEKDIVKAARSAGSRVEYIPPKMIVELATELTQEDCYLMSKLLQYSDNPVIYNRNAGSHFTFGERIRMEALMNKYGLVHINKENNTYEVCYTKNFVSSLRFAINEWRAKQREKEREKQEVVYKTLEDVNRIKVSLEIKTENTPSPGCYNFYSWIKFDETFSMLLTKVLENVLARKSVFYGTKVSGNYSSSYIDWDKSKFYPWKDGKEIKATDKFYDSFKEREEELVEIANKGRIANLSCTLVINKKYL